MKRFAYALIALLALSCSEFDDSAIWDKLNNHELRITELEKICKEMNADIIKLQTLVTALENQDCIVSAAPLATEDGYAFVFKSGKSVVIYHGEDGKDGTNGENGKDGKDGVNGKDGITPQIGVRQDTDGFFYWTVNGEWLLVDGKKVRASASDGENGEDGKDAITPKFKIEGDNWYVSYDNEKTWELLGRATGNDAFSGEDGKSIFKRTYIEDGYVCFELNDETNTVVRIPLLKNDALTISLEKEGTLSRRLSYEQQRTTTSLVLTGKINNDDMRAIQVMTNLQVVDLSGAEFIDTDNGYRGFKLNPYQDTLINKSITELLLPNLEETIFADFSYCIALRRVVVTCDFTQFLYSPDSYDGTSHPITFVPSLKEIEYAEGVTKVKGAASSYKLLDRVTYPSTIQYIPKGLTHFVKYETVNSSSTLYYYYTIPCDTIICKAIVPPTIDTSVEGKSITYDFENKWYTSYSYNKRYYYKVNVPTDAVLYVPRESIEAYRAAPIWDNFTNILPLEDLEE